MLELARVSVRYGSGRQALTAVEDVSLEIPRGGTLGLVGESGSGKSTLARAVSGLLPLAAGTIRFDGKDHTAMRARQSAAYRRRVQMIFQDPFSSLNPRMTVGQMLAEALMLRGMSDRKKRRLEAQRLLDIVGVGSAAVERYPHQFSGGQRQRLAIARALAVEPELIVMDEVTSALDVSVQATILNLLRELQQDLGLTYLFITHDLAVVGLMSDVVAVMYLGRLVECTAAGELLAAPRHPYTQALIKSVPRINATRTAAPVRGDLPDPRHPPAGCRFHTRCPIGPRAHEERTICIELDPQAEAPRREHLAACHFAAEAPKASAVVG